jgi:hypothetical protein
MHLQSSSMKSAKTKEKENRSFTGDPGVSKNHATAHKHYSYESWLRIWNPGLFLIRTRGPFPFSVRTEDGGGSPVPASRDLVGGREVDGKTLGARAHSLVASNG